VSDVKRLLALVRPFWRHLALAAIALSLGSLLGLVQPWVLQQLVDQVFLDRNTRLLNWIVLGLVGVMLTRSVLQMAQGYLLAWAGERVVASLRRTLYAHLLTQPLGFFADQHTGELISRVSNDTQTLQNAIVGNVVTLFRQSLTFVGGVLIILVLDWRLAGLALVAVPGAVVLSRLMGRQMRRLSNIVQDALAEATAVAEETLSGIRIVQAFTRERHEAGRFGAQIDRLLQAAMHRARVSATYSPLIALSFSLSTVAILWFGSHQVLRGELTPGQLIAFLFYAQMLIGPLYAYAGTYGQLNQALGASQRIFALLDTPPSIDDAPDAIPLPTVKGGVAFRDVSFYYDARQPVLSEVNVDVQAGEMVALVGPSGVGKTTLANLIPRFYDPTAGQVEIDGLDLRRVTLRSLREQIGIVSQEPVLFSTTVRENIAYADPDASPAQIEEAARAAHAHGFIENDLPDGYDTPVGERGVKLSGGQRQRVAIARAILKDPCILILDEATSHLDTEAEQHVQAALDELLRRRRTGDDRTGCRTTFVIAHRLSTITNADRIVVLDGGQVVEQGTHAELLAREGSLYRHYHALQFRWDEDRQAPPAAVEPPRPAPREEGWTDVAVSLLVPPPPDAEGLGDGGHSEGELPPGR
jgi:subfamily B ATP-binding cassette protein MsbA